MVTRLGKLFRRHWLRVEDYEKAFLQLLIDHLDQGWSVNHFRGTYAISEPVMREWRRIDPDLDRIIREYNKKKSEHKMSHIANAVHLANKK